MARSQAGQSNPLSVFFLKKHGYLDKDLSWKAGTVSWSYGMSENKSSIEIISKKDNWNTPYERATLNLKYTHTDHWNGEKSNMNFEIELTTTPCRYGGKRYWFVCPLNKNGQYCGKRVGVIYSIGKCPDAGINRVQGAGCRVQGAGKSLRAFK